MKEIYISIKMIWKQKFMNLIILLSIICSIYYLVPAFTQIVNYYNIEKSLKHFDMKDSYYLYRSPFYGWDNSELRASQKDKFKTLDYIEGYAEYYNLSDDTLPYNVMVYNNELIKKFTPELSQGDWLDIDYNGSNIPAVVGSQTGLTYGELFYLPITRGEKEITLACQVIGIFAANCNIVEFSGGADTEYFTDDIIMSKSNQAVILPITENILESIGKYEYLMCSRGSVIYTCATDRETVIQDLGYAGTIIDLELGYDKFCEQSKIIVSAMGTCWIIYFLITVFCIICSNVVLNERMKNVYAIYYLTGMSMKKSKIVDYIRILLLILISTIVSFFFLIGSGILENNLQHRDFIFVFCALIVYVSITTVPASIWFIYKRGKQSILEALQHIDS